MGWIDSKSIALVSTKLVNDAKSILEKGAKINKIPDKYQRPVIEELLDKKKCICGRELEPGSDPATMVKTLLDEAADSEQIDRHGRIQHNIGNLGEKYTSAVDGLKSIISDRATYLGRISDIEKSINSIDDQFKSIDVSEVKRLRNSRGSILSALRKERDAKSKADLAIEAAEKVLATLYDEKKRIEADQQRKSEISIKQSLVETAIEKLEEILDGHIDESRKVIQKTVNDFLEVAAARQISISISETFELTVTKSGSKDPITAGEDQLIGLVFTAALVDLAKQRVNADGELLLPGTVAPLFLDAPFGQLDTNYQQKTAKILPALSEQLILLLSDSQGNDKVRDVLNPKVGKQAVIIQHIEDEKQEGQPDHAITLFDRTIPRALYSQERNASFIEEID